MKKLKRFLGKRVFGKGSPRPPAFCGATLEEFLDVFHFVGRFFTAGVGSRGKRSGRLGQSDSRGHFPVFPAAPKFFGRTARRVSPSSGRTLLEMLGVLAVVGVLSITALAGLTYAMNKHRANSIYNDVHLLALHVMDTGKDTVPADFYPDSGRTYSLDTTTYADGFVVKVSDVSEKVCDRIMEVKDASIEKIYVGSEEATTCSGTQTLGFMFLYDGKLTSGGSGSGTEPDPVDPCEGIVPTQDCSLSADVTDENGCVTVKKITCTGDTYCSVNTCEPCPAAETCDGESCCALIGSEDVCGRPTKEIGTLSTVTHSDVNANGCCEETTEESCSLNPVTPRTCTATCDGTCQSDGSCRPNCETGSTYNETAGKCCEDLTETTCQKATTATSGTCPVLSNVADGIACTTTDNADGTCQSGVCEETVAASCGDEIVTGLNNGHEYCMSINGMTWDDAKTWCEARGRHLASMEEMCPGWDGTTGMFKCANLAGVGSCGVWSSSLDLNSSSVFYVHLNNRTVNTTFQSNTGYAAFCY